MIAIIIISLVFGIVCVILAAGTTLASDFPLTFRDIITGWFGVSGFCMVAIVLILIIASILDWLFNGGTLLASFMEKINYLNNLKVY
jgi:hypothetical protein